LRYFEVGKRAPKALKTVPLAGMQKPNRTVMVLTISGFHPLGVGLHERKALVFQG